MITFFPKNILLIGTVADLSPFRRLKNEFKMYVHMYICMYICTYHVRLIWTLMPGKHKYDKDKSNGDLLWRLCPEKFWIFRTVLIGEMCYILAAHCSLRFEHGARHISSCKKSYIMAFYELYETHIFTFTVLWMECTSPFSFLHKDLWNSIR